MTKDGTQTGVRIGFGETSSQDARTRFAENVLHKASCPICGSKPLQLLQLSGDADDPARPLEFGLPVIVPGGPDLLSVGALLCGVCMNCGYIAQFMDAVVMSKFGTAQEPSDD